MTADRPISRYLAHHPSLAVGGYVALVIILLVAIWASLTDVYQRRQALANMTDLLNRLEAHEHSARVKTMSGSVPSGSPFLQGSTVTIAGAALLQRVASAITRHGGNVLSSQVDLNGAHAKQGFVTLVISCEVAQTNLQALMYDVEAGMPFLFIDQLVATAPQTSAAADGGRLQLLLAVTGQWRGGQ